MFWEGHELHALWRVKTKSPDETCSNWDYHRHTGASPEGPWVFCPIAWIFNSKPCLPPISSGNNSPVTQSDCLTSCSHRPWPLLPAQHFLWHASLACRICLCISRKVGSGLALLSFTVCQDRKEALVENARKCSACCFQVMDSNS